MNNNEFKLLSTYLRSLSLIVDRTFYLIHKLDLTILIT